MTALPLTHASVPDAVPLPPELHIGDGPADPAADTAQLRDLAAALRREAPRVLGFPGNLDFDFSDLAPALSVLINNVGDPASADASDVHTKAYEQAVVRFLAQTAGADPDDVYGYVTTGGTEGILLGLATARRHLPHAHVYASDQAHYSVAKAADLLGLTLVTLPSNDDGTLNSESLKVASFFHRRVRPHGGRGPGAIVVATIGTTMRGAYDDVTELRKWAGAAGGIYVHADAASGGPIAAHAPSAPRWSFAHGADSISISGHKVIGAPVPCGVVLVRKNLVEEPTIASEYTNASARTLGCSRSGLAALFLWSALRRLGHTGLRTHILRCLETAQYAVDQLTRAGARPTRTTDSLTVCIDRPAEWIVRKWHLACEGNTAHLITVGHVTRTTIDELCRDLRTP
ncbi:histidine decarboxylase [Streptomyces sp. NPDC001787]|uniref:histidine decarboxylase n=1 Tax=Streptomyces sp. NPDC001787 TaxID=3154523 RepID=UPI003321DAA5